MILRLDPESLAMWRAIFAPLAASGDAKPVLRCGETAALVVALVDRVRALESAPAVSVTVTPPARPDPALDEAAARNVLRDLVAEHAGNLRAAAAELGADRLALRRALNGTGALEPLMERLGYIRVWQPPTPARHPVPLAAE